MGYTGSMRVFSFPYLFLAAVVALATFSITAFFSYIPYTYSLFSNSSVSFARALELTIGLFAFSIEKMPLISLSHAALTSLLIGINVALLSFYVRRFGGAPSTRNMASGTFGGALALAMALFGFGCLSCGSIFFASLFTALGGAGLLAAVPYLGVGVSLLGIGLLTLSAVLLVRAINTPAVC